MKIRLLLLIALCSSIPFHAKETCKKVYEFPFTTDNGWIEIPVTVYGDTCRFVFDTGAVGVTWVNPNKIEIKQDPDIKRPARHRINTVSTDGSRNSIINVYLFKKKFFISNHEVEVVVFEEPNGNSMIQDKKIHGVYGLIGILPYNWLIDFKGHIMKRSDSAMDMDSIKHREAMRIPLKNSKLALSILLNKTKAVIRLNNGKRLNYIFDTGGSLGNPHFLIPHNSKRYPKELYDHLNSKAPDEYTNRIADSVMVNGYTLHNQSFTYYDSPENLKISIFQNFTNLSKQIGFEGIVGLDFMMQFSYLYFDSKKREFVLYK